VRIGFDSFSKRVPTTDLLSKMGGPGVCDMGATGSNWILTYFTAKNKKPVGIFQVLFEKLPTDILL
jgi:hypothetical protein